MNCKRTYVYNQHNKFDIESAQQFIKRSWSNQDNGQGKLDMDSFVTYTVSTTYQSSHLLIATKGGSNRTMFTRNTYSADKDNPWLLFQHAKFNLSLAQHIHKSWNEMQVNSQNGRAEVDKIAPHILYKSERGTNNWTQVSILNAVNDDNVVRFHSEDIEIWSHPARDFDLTESLEKDESRMIGDFKSLIGGWIKIRVSTKIPNDRKATALENQRVKVREKFLKVYSKIKKAHEEPPNSYRYPTLQLAQRKSDAKLQRYGETVAGLYSDFDNKVHHIFQAKGIQARPLPQVPSQETIYLSFYNKIEAMNEQSLRFDDMIATNSGPQEIAADDRGSEENKSDSNLDDMGLSFLD